MPRHGHLTDNLQNKVAGLLKGKINLTPISYHSRDKKLIDSCEARRAWRDHNGHSQPD
jgi:hypothetical protein